MKTVQANEQRTVVENIRDDVATWSSCVDGLIRAFRESARSIPGLAAKLEALRNWRDTVEVKAHALERHRGTRFEQARRDYDEARQELGAAWRSVLATLQRYDTSTIPSGSRS